nr:MAG TPA: hypothetical protein [Caudoviricetes sp.]
MDNFSDSVILLLRAIYNTLSIILFRLIFISLTLIHPKTHFKAF